MSVQLNQLSKLRQLNEISFMRVVKFAVLACLLTGNFLTIHANDTIPDFIAKGTVSSEAFETTPKSTNCVVKKTGVFFFSIKSNDWRVQFTYQSNYVAELPNLSDISGTVSDVRSIPDGIREIFTFSENSIPPGEIKTKASPSAIATTNRFPDWGAPEVFLPWLALCPRPELPYISSNLMRVDFSSEFLNNDKNVGRFSLSYINPENQFLSNLVVTNRGPVIMADGSTEALPIHYEDGYPQFSYEVLKTTNCSGINFPLDAALYCFAPKPAGRSAKELDPYVINRLHVDQIDVGNKQLSLNQIPTNLVGLDRRPAGLNNGVTVNYGVDNDKWFPVTNSRMALLAKLTRHSAGNQISERKKYGRNRVVVFVILGFVAAAPMIIFALKTKQTISQKQS